MRTDIIIGFEHFDKCHGNTMLSRPRRAPSFLYIISCGMTILPQDQAMLESEGWLICEFLGIPKVFICRVLTTGASKPA